MLDKRPAVQFYLGLAIMVAATVLMIRDTIGLQHTHEHQYGEMVYSHEHLHTHIHTHIHEEDESKHGHIHECLDGYDHAHNFA